jgi:hypothetical protein
MKMKRQTSFRILIMLLIALGAVIIVGYKASWWGGKAPPFEEIRQNIYHITKHDIDPEEPKVGRDGQLDPQVGEALVAYQNSLLGKQAEAWHGWYGGYTDDRVAIYMTKPEGRRIFYTDILIRNVPSEQMAKVKLLEEDQPLVFSGKIIGILLDGRVWLEFSSIEPISVGNIP